MLRLSRAERLMRQDRAREALAALGGSSAPPKDLPRRHRPDWYRLAGWALIAVGEPHKAIRLLRCGMKLAEVQRARASDLWEARRLAEMAERLRCYLGVAYCSLDQSEQALAHYRQGLAAIAQKIVIDPELKLLIYKGLGQAALTLGRFQDAIFYYQAAARQADDLDNARQQGLVYWGMGLAYQKSGDLLRARQSYEQALEALERHGNRRLLASMQTLYGQVLTNLGDYEGAEKTLNVSLALARYFGDVHTCGVALVNLAALSIARGEPDQAIAEIHEALPMVKQGGNQRVEGQLHLTLASAYEAKQDVAATEREVKEALRLFEQIKHYDMICLAHERYAHCLAHQGHFAAAYAQMRQAYTASSR